MKKTLNIMELFELSVASNPNGVAIECGKNSISYAELSMRSDIAAYHLAKTNGVKPGDFIGLIVAEKSIDLLVIILGILKAGGAYIPINRSLPESLIRRISSLLEIKCYLTDSYTAKISDKETISFSCLTDTTIPKHETLTRKTISSEIAYGMLSSGTTGNPKCILISHSSLVYTFKSWEKVYKLDSNDKHLQMANVSFDVFTGDWVRALCSGGTLVLCQTMDLLKPSKIHALLEHHRPTIGEFVPSTLNLLTSYLSKNNYQLSCMRIIICGSDSWRVSDCKETMKLCPPQTKLFNSYGLTEATIDTSYFKVTKSSLRFLGDSDMVPIGIPFPHAKIKVLNEDGNYVKPGELGEIFVGGKGVSPYGYLGDPKLTKARFIKDPGNSELMYKTGDIAHVCPNGNIVLIGRNDFQMKIHGKLVDLSKTELLLSSHPEVKYAILSVKDVTSSSPKIHAYLHLRKDILHEDIEDFMWGKVPENHLPHKYLSIEEVPLTPNGKVDRDVTRLNRISRQLMHYDKARRSNIELKIESFWKESLEIDVVHPHQSFWSLGGDSFLMMETLSMIKNDFGVDINCSCGISSLTQISKLVSDRLDVTDNSTA